MMPGSSLSPVWDVAGELRRGVDHGEEDEGVCLLFYRRGMVGWSGLATWACCWAAEACFGRQVSPLSLSFLFLFYFLF
jgi:hypothetical protein